MAEHVDLESVLAPRRPRRNLIGLIVLTVLFILGGCFVGRATAVQQWLHSLDSKISDADLFPTVSSFVALEQPKRQLKPEDANQLRLKYQASSFVALEQPKRQLKLENGNQVQLKYQAWKKRILPTNEPWQQRATTSRPLHKADTENKLIVPKKDSQRKFARNHLCVNGSVLPVLQVLGAQKSASSTLYHDVQHNLDLRADLDCKSNWWQCKEIHYFDNEHDGNAVNYSDLWGSCKSRRSDRIVADFTPDYLWVPEVPDRMADFYGEAKDDVVFVISLREPMARLGSAFHNGIVADWLYKDVLIKPTLNSHLEDYLRLLKRSEKDEPWLDIYEFRTVKQSLYYHNIRGWLRRFHPGQFIVFPGRQYLDNRSDLNQNPVLNDLRIKLGAETLDTTGRKVKASVNKGHHRSMDKDVEPAVLEQMREVFRPWNRRLAELLANASAAGMSLVGYSGDPKKRDTPAVMRWLEAGWNF